MLEDDHIFKDEIESGKIFHQKGGKPLRFDSMKQDIDALSVGSSFFCVLALTKHAVRRRLVAADSSWIACHLVEVFRNKFSCFSGLPSPVCASMTVAVQLAARFIRTKFYHFKAIDNRDVMTTTGVMLRDVSKRNSEKAYRLVNERHTFSVGPVEFCRTELEQLIRSRIIGLFRRNSLHETDPVTAGMPAILWAIMRIGTMITGIRLLVEFSWMLNCNHGKSRWDKRNAFSECE
jgi:hypothetical protein